MVEIRLKASDTDLLVGAPVQVSLPADEPLSAVAVPRDALVEYSIQRLLPVIVEERERHLKRKEILNGMLGADLIGFHTYDYEGGVDLGADPPPDGEYTVYAEAVAVARSAIEVGAGRTARRALVAAERTARGLEESALTELEALRSELPA